MLIKCVLRVGIKIYLVSTSRVNRIRVSFPQEGSVHI